MNCFVERAVQELQANFASSFFFTSSQSMYEPGKRHWLKVKKDYLAGGSMADTADLIVLGAYYGTGNKGTCTCTCRPKLHMVGHQDMIVMCVM